jgi:serine/threonine protein kinase
VCAIRDVHKYGYVHNDLKIDNFVLNKGNGFFFFLYIYIYIINYFNSDLKFPLKCKLVDFGLCQTEENSINGNVFSGTSQFFVYYCCYFRVYFIFLFF